jgi:hypothetical protein
MLIPHVAAAHPVAAAPQQTTTSDSSTGTPFDWHSPEHHHESCCHQLPKGRAQKGCLVSSDEIVFELKLCIYIYLI